MNDKILGLMGLMRRASAIEIGEVNTGGAVKAGKAKLLLLASDASHNAIHRAETFVYGHSTVLLTLPYTKEEISKSVGLGGCSMAAVTDIGFANALMKALADRDKDSYGELSEEVESRFLKAEHRKKKRPSAGASKGTV